jgi:AcrR family transcriptional regulator
MTTHPDVSDEPATRPMRRDAARNRQLLVDAAREVFAARGLDATLDDVARHAGVGVGTAYRHFANKYELAGAIIDRAVDEVVADAFAARDAADPWDGLVGFLESLLARQAADRGLREVLTGAKDESRLVEMQSRVTEPVEALVARAQAAGAVRPDVAISDFAMVMTMLCAVADLGGDVRPELWRRYLPTLLAGFRPGGPDLPVRPLSPEEFLAASIAAHSAARA